MEPSFVARLAYLRFLKYLEIGRPPTNVEIANAAGLTPEAVSQWIARDAAPTKYDTVQALVAYFAIPGGERWLVKGIGEPPTPEVWTLWHAARQRDAAAEVIARAGAKLTDKHGTPRAQDLLQQTPATKKVAGAKKGRGRGR